MPRIRRPDLGLGRQSNVRQAMSRTNRTDEQQDTQNVIVVLACQDCVLE